MQVPVIHADGCTDDLPGLIAAFENRPVEFGGRVYAPGEDIVIGSGKNIYLSRAIWPTGDDDTAEELAEAERMKIEGMAVVHFDGGRDVAFAPDCLFTVEGGGEGFAAFAM